jgi:putative copper export protein
MMNPRTPSWPRLADGATLVLAIAPPFLAHAGAATELRVVSIVVDIIHGLAAGGWVGALALLTTAIIRERHAPDGAARSAQLIAAFHPVALVAAGTVFATGLGTAWLRMGAPEGIASPTYSGLFVAKLLLAGVTGWIGAGHSKLATRRVASVEPRAVSRTLLTECLIAVCVLILTAVLVGTAPIG